MQKNLGFVIGGGAKKAIALNDLDRFFPTLFPGTSQRTVLALYRLVAWTYRCVQLRANGTMSVPWKLSRRGNEDSEVELERTPYGDVDWEWLWWRTEAARLIWGASYWLKRADGELQWLNPGTMTALTEPSGIVGFEQRTVGGVPRRYPVDQIVYLPTWNLTDDLQPGVADAGVAQPPGALVANANEWTSKFFENGALPLTVLSTDQVVPKQEIERLETIWERFKSGIKNAFKTVVLGRGLTPTVIGFPLDKLALPALMQEEKEQVSAAFGIPITMLDASAANFATAKQDDLHFYTKTIFPQLRLARGSVNRQLWWPLGYEMHWQYNDVEAIQQDEAEKGEATALLMEEMDRQKASQVLTRPRSVWLAEQLWATLGYEFPADKPDEEPEEPEPTEQMPPNMLEQRQRVSEIAQGVQAAEKSVKVDNTAMLASLRRWRRKVKNRKGAADFESESIPEWVSRAVKKRLAIQLETAFDPFLKALPDIQGGLEATLQRKISAIYADWLDRITNAALTGTPTDLAPMYTEIQAATELMYTDAINSGALAQAADLGWGVDYDELLTEGLEFAGREGATLVGRISGTDRKYVDKIRAQVQAGEITEEAATELIAKAFGKVRANAIAITETTRGLAGAAFALQADLAAQGVTTQQRWLTAEDERVCPICGPLDHTTEDSWLAAYPTGPPAHVNCRCEAVVELVA